MQDQARALGQKYLGIRPQGNHLEEMFRDTRYRGDSSHPVPVSNFLNAQCKQSRQLDLLYTWLMASHRLLRDHHRLATTSVQGCPRHR